MAEALFQSSAQLNLRLNKLQLEVNYAAKFETMIKAARLLLMTKAGLKRRSMSRNLVCLTVPCRREKVTTDFNLLHERLETERKHLIEELEQLKVDVRQGGERRQGETLASDEVAMSTSSWISTRHYRKE